MTTQQRTRVLFALIVGTIAYVLYRLTEAAPVAGASILIAFVVLMLYARSRQDR